VWLLDLDNTLHDAGRAILPRINTAMNQYLASTLGLDAAQAAVLRTQYWRRYGATLLGMMRHHDADPHDFLARTHPYDELPDLVAPDFKLQAMLRRLPGAKVLLTNAPQAYARIVVARLGIARQLDGILAIEHMQAYGVWQPKPSAPMLKRLIVQLGVAPARAVLVEDSVENLKAARRSGVRTVLVRGFHSQYRRPLMLTGGRPPGVEIQIQSVLTLARCRTGRRSQHD
jgi:putative hydrolase of the HAD superfamily